MDDYEPDGLASAPGDEYAALADAIQVMREVVELVEDLHRATTRFGDALVSAGLPAREWREPDCQLLMLSDQFPDITLDDLVTRLAEFAAGMGPHWLHGDSEDVARFNDEVSILCGVVRPLRVAAQRLRMLPVRERGDYPLERALGDPRAGTPLDRITTVLRDLEALGPYIQPLTPEEWNPPAPQPVWTPTPGREPMPAQAPAALAGNAVPPTSPAYQRGTTSDWPAMSAPLAGETRQPSPQSEAFRRLRDFMPPPGSRPVPAARAGAMRVDWPSLRARGTALAGAAAHWLRPRKWVVIGVVVMLLALGTALLTLGSQQAPATSSLTAQPARLAFTCSGAGAAGSIKLRDTDSRPLTWTIVPPAGLALSATRGSLQPSAFVIVRIHVTAAKAAKGMLAFASTGGSVSIPYSVTCGK